MKQRTVGQGEWGTLCRQGTATFGQDAPLGTPVVA